MRDDRSFGTLVLRHDVDNAPSLRLRLSPLARDATVEDVPTIGPDSLGSPLVSYRQSTSYALPADLYVFAAFDGDGRRVGGVEDVLPLDVIEGATTTITAQLIVISAFLEARPSSTAGSTSTTPPSEVHDCGLLKIVNNSPDVRGVRCRITAADSRQHDSPSLASGQDWAVLLRPGDYTISARTMGDESSCSDVAATMKAHDVVLIELPNPTTGGTG